MPFNSYSFILAFLPLAVSGYRIATLFGPRPAKVWLLLCSMAFYGFWSPVFIAVLSLSIAFNYATGSAIRAPSGDESRKRQLLIFGIGGNLALLFYAKYLPGLIAALGGAPMPALVSSFIIPIGIPFFTLVQIGYLVDCSGGQTAGRGFIEYALFVFFFPTLVSGPILRHRELVPQLDDPATYRFRAEDLAVGITLFTIGLAKKAAIADYLAPFANTGYSDTSQVEVIRAWATVVCYSLQLYFDFSGYSDMALGIACLFGIRLPVNFNSPYKARSVIDYWQNWHMSLTRFITRYIYNPLAMRAARRRAQEGKPSWNRKTADASGFIGMVAFPMTVTMILAGIWHGAGLQFLIFGLLHAVYLTVNHAWRMFGPAPNAIPSHLKIPAIAVSWTLTYLAVIVAQVFFRAPSTAAAMDMLFAMAGLHGIASANDFFAPGADEILALIALLAATVILPNSQQILADYAPASTPVKPSGWRWLRWRPNLICALIAGFALFFALGSLGESSQFVYFQF